MAQRDLPRVVRRLPLSRATRRAAGRLGAWARFRRAGESRRSAISVQRSPWRAQSAAYDLGELGRARSSTRSVHAATVGLVESASLTRDFESAARPLLEDIARGDRDRLDRACERLGALHAFPIDGSAFGVAIVWTGPVVAHRFVSLTLISVRVEHRHDFARSTRQGARPTSVIWAASCSDASVERLSAFLLVHRAAIDGLSVPIGSAVDP